jgi:hypothetical protein
MWGNIIPRPFTSLNNVRKIITSSAGHDIVYNSGGKDSFQVSIIENGSAYSMRDVDYFTVVLNHYEQNPEQINNCLIWFTTLIDKDAGGFYDTFKGAILNSPQRFDITGNTFGYNDQLLKQNLMAFRSRFTASKFTDPTGELEESLSIIYLAMVSEWYYGFDYDGIDTGKRSKWQHRVKLLGLSQVLSGQLTPLQASKWSFDAGVSKVSPALRSFKIYDQPYQLTK